MSLTSPLGLTRHLHRPDLRLALLPCFNVLLLGWMFSLFGSHYVYAPGIAVSLDPGVATTLTLPTIVSERQSLSARPTDVVLTVFPSGTSGRETLFGLENGLHTLLDLKTPLRNSRLNLPADAPAVLLFKGSGDLPMQTFLQVCVLAQEAGFATVQIAVKAAAADAPLAPMTTAPAPAASSTTK
jgi:biopolymer transport protein ExbD